LKVFVITRLTANSNVDEAFLVEGSISSSAVGIIVGAPFFVGCEISHRKKTV